MRVLLTIVLALLTGSMSDAQTITWQQTNGPFNRQVTTSVHALCFGPNGSLFAGERVGVYRSTDRGANWHLVHPTKAPVTCIMYDSTSQTLYATTPLLGLYRSGDGGDSWIEMTNTGLVAADFNAIYRAPNGYLYLAAIPSDGVVRSTDNGASWQVTNTGLDYRRTHALVSSGVTGDLYVAEEWMGVYRSTDQGGRWQRWSAGDHVGPNSFCLALDSLGTLWVGGTVLKSYTVWRSDDRAVTWTPSAPLSIDGVIGALLVDDQNRIVAGTSGGVFRTEDRGTSWQRLGDSLAGQVWSLLPDGSGGYFAGTDTLGLFYMVPADAGGDGHWAHLPLQSPPTYISVNDLSLDSLTGFVLARTSDGTRYVTTDRGHTWSFKDIWPLSYRVSPWGDIYRDTVSGLMRSTDQGSSWTVVAPPIADRRPYATLAFKNPGLIVAGGDKNWIHRSTDRGLTWEMDSIYTPGPDVSGSSFMSFTRMKVTPQGSILTTYLEYLDYHYYGYPRSGVKRSADDGRSWQQSDFGVWPLNASTDITSLFGLSNGDLYAGLAQGFFLSTDDGATWSKLSDGYVSGIFSYNGGGVFSNVYNVPWATDLQPYFSFDSCRSWIQHATGLPNPVRYTSAVFDTEGYLYLGTTAFQVTLGGVGTQPSSGVFRSSLPIAGNAPDDYVIPTTYMLSQNYPNPFNGKTVVSSRYPVAGHVKLTVYDLLGREVRVLVNERRLVGTYRDTFDGSGLSSGVYFYRLTTEAFVASKRMVLMK